MAPFLRLRDVRSGDVLAFEQDEVRIGRNPDLDLVPSGAGSDVVSGSHARVVYEKGAWFLEDLGSRNGTYLRGQRLVPGARERLVQAVEFGLGETGPKFRVEAVAKRLIADTAIEGPAVIRPSAATIPMSALDVVPRTPPEKKPAVAPLPSADKPPPPRASPPKPKPAKAAPPPPPTGSGVFIRLREARSGERFEASGTPLRLGRGTDCELRPVATGDTSVSRVHAEITLGEDGKPSIRDAGSRNGTIVNGRMLVSAQTLKQGDRIQLGDAGPELVVETLSVRASAPPPPAAPSAPPAPAGTAPRQSLSVDSPVAPKAVQRAKEPDPRRSYGGKGKTVFFREMFEETERKTSRKVRWIVWAFVGLVALVAGGMYWYSEWRTRQTVAELQAQQEEVMSAQQAIADSMRRAAQADLGRLREELEQARISSAPASVVDSLRAALDQASNRTAALEASLERAQRSLGEQLAAGDAQRRQAQSELERMRAELERARSTATPAALVDSLRRAIAAAETNASAIESRLRAVQGVDLAALSQANQAAVGLVTAYFGREVTDGSGFAITRSGYFVTNRHVVTDAGRPADSIYVTMADQRVMRRADLVRVAGASGPDLSLLKVRGFDGPVIGNVDWSGTKARQGEPAALIGFPSGMALALDETRTVRTSMSAGIFSKVTADRIQFDGFTVGGSSGSPIFNATGEVVAVHRAGLRDAVGLSFAVPIQLLVPLLPPEVKAELGI